MGAAATSNGAWATTSRAALGGRGHPITEGLGIQIEHEEMAGEHFIALPPEAAIRELVSAVVAFSRLLLRGTRQRLFPPRPRNTL